MRFRPTLLALAVSLAAVGSAAGAQTAAKPAATAKPASAAKPAAAAKAEPIDINTATKSDLQAVPGIGDVYATKIIANRPYHSKDELTRKKVLPAGVYAKTKDRLVARQH